MAATTSGEGGAAEAEDEDEDEEVVKDKKGKVKKGKDGKRAGKGKDKEFGVVRGIDFKEVSTVINFDVPPTAAAYLHRVGRTGRGLHSSSFQLNLSHF